MSTQPPSRLRVVKDRKFVNQTLVLDGVRYENCHFIGCTLVYAGGDSEMSSCYVHAGTENFKDLLLRPCRCLSGTDGTSSMATVFFFFFFFPPPFQILREVCLLNPFWGVACAI